MGVLAETSLPQNLVNWLVAGVVIFNVLTALNPASPTFSEENQRDVRKRPKGPTQDPRIDPSNPVVRFQPWIFVDEYLNLKCKQCIEVSLTSVQMFLVEGYLGA